MGVRARGLVTSVVLLLCAGPCLADQLVDPATVAPEYRAAAEKRRAEQLKVQSCQHRATEQKVPVRDRAAFVAACLDGSSAANEQR
ncbi:MAG: hypothetical protein P4M07_14600 [Xanthobacteraceae bacterium]|nr:hypothetical protein [Xanthobacteraceae bacterium]